MTSRIKIIGPENYRLDFDATKYVATCAQGKKKFSGFARKKLPKLYVVSVNHKPIYVGVTRRSMSGRLRDGWKAKGLTGYYGYAWRHKYTTASLDIWTQKEGPPSINLNFEMETIEAELVFLIRQSGQWPMFQTEIHFHPSKAIHRRLARQIAEHIGVA